jgi:peptidoglycan/LPS O-acetylase OafA/YrhL
VNGPLWSLSYEIGFYLAAGLLMTILRGRGAMRLISLLLLGGLAWLSIENDRYLFLHYGSLWVLGAWLFFFLSEKHHSRVLLWLLFLVCAAVNVPLLKRPGTIVSDGLYSLAVLLLLWFLARWERVIFRPLAKLADSTYTLYLFHFPLLLTLYALIRDWYDNSHAAYFMVGTLFTIALIPACHLLAKFLENRRWWERLMSRRPGERAPVGAAGAQ